MNSRGHRRQDSNPEPPDDKGWGVPDWKDAAGYPAQEELSVLAWRWEFLRRNHDYRRVYKLPGSTVFPDGLDFVQYIQNFFGIRYDHDPRKSARQILAEDYDDPAAFNEFFIDSSVTLLFENLVERGSVDIGALPADDVVIFYLRRSLPAAAQASRVRHILAEMQTSEIDIIYSRPDLWSRYLRILDAQDARATYGQIASVILGKKGDGHAARDSLNAAQLLRKHPDRAGFMDRS